MCVVHYFLFDRSQLIFISFLRVSVSSRAQWRVFGVGGGCIIVELVVRVMFFDEKKVVKKLKKVLTHTMILTLLVVKEGTVFGGLGFVS